MAIRVTVHVPQQPAWTYLHPYGEDERLHDDAELRHLIRHVLKDAYRDLSRSPTLNMGRSR